MEGFLLIIFFMVALFLNIPICFALAISALTLLLITHSAPVGLIIQSLFSATDSFPLMAVPLFILAGEVMVRGGISEKLIILSRVLIGRINGSTGMVGVLSSMFFAAVSGSGPATVSAIGGTMIPAMTEENYDKSFATALMSAAGSIGPVIPPSIAFIIYGVIARVSISDLFIAGIIPGILMGISLMFLVYFVTIKYDFGIKSTREKFNFKEIFKAFKEAMWGIIMPIIVLGGIYAGIFTPTEAAVIAVDYGLIISLFVYKGLKWRDLPKVFFEASLTSGTVLILVGCATAFGRMMVIEGVPEAISKGILGVTSNKIFLLLLVNLVLFIIGMFVETLAAIIIFAPLLLEIVIPLGINPIHFGIIMVVNLVIGMCTPPVGVNLFVGTRIANIAMEDTFKWLIPIIGVLLVDLLIITFVPQISMVLLN